MTTPLLTDIVKPHPGGWFVFNNSITCTRSELKQFLKESYDCFDMIFPEFNVGPLPYTDLIKEKVDELLSIRRTHDVCRVILSTKAVVKLKAEYGSSSTDDLLGKISMFIPKAKFFINTNIKKVDYYVTC